MSDVDNTLVQQRMDRLQAAVGKVGIDPCDFLALPGPLLTVTCSRLGHDPHVQRGVCRFLNRSLLEYRGRGATLLIADGSAIAPWAGRAAELMAVPVVSLIVGKTKADKGSAVGAVTVKSVAGRSLSRDAVTIALADRVDALYVRRGGTIARCLHKRVEQLRDASTRVAVSMTQNCAAQELIATGVVGWYGTRYVEQGRCLERDDRETVKLADDCWADTDGQWLIHCTRACRGPWPGETSTQYRDSILLGDDRSVQRAPIDALMRIVRSGRLVAAATATSKSHPVVCFSALPIRELLQARCFRPHLGRWDYEPYGIAIRTSVAKRHGLQPVIYGSKEDRIQIPAEDQYRFHPVGTTYDWTTEREWRSKHTIDLNLMNPDDIRVFVSSIKDAKQIAACCKWPISLLGG